MSINGPGGGFNNIRLGQAAQTSGVFKPETKSTDKAGKAGNAGSAAAAAPKSDALGTSFSNLLGTADVAPPPSFHEVAQQVVSNVAQRDPQEALDDFHSPEVKQFLQLGYVPVEHV